MVSLTTYNVLCHPKYVAHPFGSPHYMHGVFMPCPAMVRCPMTFRFRLNLTSSSDGLKIGGNGRIRTYDLQRFKMPLYQLSYISISCTSVPYCHVYHSAVYLQRHVQDIRFHSRQFSNYSITRSRHKQRHSIL